MPKKRKLATHSLDDALNWFEYRRGWVEHAKGVFRLFGTQRAVKIVADGSSVASVLFFVGSPYTLGSKNKVEQFFDAGVHLTERAARRAHVRRLKKNLRYDKKEARRSALRVRRSERLLEKAERELRKNLRRAIPERPVR